MPDKVVLQRAMDGGSLDLSSLLSNTKNDIGGNVQRLLDADQAVTALLKDLDTTLLTDSQKQLIRGLMPNKERPVIRNDVILLTTCIGICNVLFVSVLQRPPSSAS